MAAICAASAARGRCVPCIGLLHRVSHVVREPQQSASDGSDAHSGGGHRRYEARGPPSEQAQPNAPRLRGALGWRRSPV